MFFGTEVKNNQNRATSMTMDCDVKLSQAVLDPASKGNKKEPVCLMAEVQGKSFILAVLDPAQSWQSPLDLILGAGTEVKLYLKGQGIVHLTGYEFRDDSEGDDFDLSMSSDDDDMDDEENENSPDEAESKHAAKKIKTKNSPTANGAKPSKLKPSAEGKGTSGTAALMRDVSDEDDSDDEDLSFSSVSDEDEDEDDISDSSDMDDLDLNEISSADDGNDDDDDDDEDLDDDDDDDESE